jgi:Rod binding domain-containing protein
MNASAVSSSNFNLDPHATMRRLETQSPEKQAAYAAKQFEAVLLRQFLKDALKPAMKGLSGGDEMPGKGVYEGMIVDAFAQSLSDGGGFGFANALQAQLMPAGSRSAASTDAPGHSKGLKAPGNLPTTSNINTLRSSR